MMFKLLNIFFIPAITLAIIWGIGWLWFASMIYFTTAEKITDKKEAIIVLTGGSGRINEGLNLLNNQIAPKLFISGVNKDIKKDDVLAQWEAQNAPAPCCIYLGFESTDTISNAVEIKQWTTKNNIQNFYLVTSAYHMPRAKLEIIHAMPEIDFTPHPVISETLKNNHLHFIQLTFSEYNKYLVRRIRSFKGNQK